ncbi:MAG: outer membrane protein transport protein [Verrucomicrobia bacterium]|nr:outer membrane protein transport protein [Verrucomicrobiota bacterium]
MPKLDGSFWKQHSFLAIEMRRVRHPVYLRRNICCLGRGTFNVYLLWPGILAALLSAVFQCPPVHAGSFALNEQSVSGLGTAYAGAAAQADDASTIFFNPAGIALLHQGEFQLGGQLIVPRATFTNEGSRYNLPNTPVNGMLLSGGNDGDGGVAHVLPNVYLAQPVLRSRNYGDLTVGVGLSVPFGLETDYSPGWVGRYAALRTKLTTFDIQPTIAYRLFDRISFGASLDIQYASARLTQAIDFGLAGAELTAQFEQALPGLLAARGVPASAIPSLVTATEQAYSKAGFVPGGRDGVLEVAGDDWKVGFTLGAIVEYWKGNEQSFFQDGRFGVSYRSGISHTLRGNASFRDVPAITAAGAPVQFPQPNAFQDLFFDQNATAQVDLPEIYHLGLYQRFQRQYAIMGDIAWTRWSTLQSVPIVFQNAATPTTVLQLDYKDALRYAVGFEWYATKNLTLRVGFAYDETPIRSASFRTPRIPDNNRYFVSIGLRWSPTHFMDIDVGYAHLFVQDSTVDFTDTQGHELRGKFDSAVDIVSAAVTFRWGGPKAAAPAAPQLPGKEPVGYSK